MSSCLVWTIFILMSELHGKFVDRSGDSLAVDLGSELWGERHPLATAVPRHDPSGVVTHVGIKEGCVTVGDVHCFEVGLLDLAVGLARTLGEVGIPGANGLLVIEKFLVGQVLGRAVEAVDGALLVRGENQEGALEVSGPQHMEEAVAIEVPLLRDPYGVFSLSCEYAALKTCQQMSTVCCVGLKF